MNTCHHPAGHIATKSMRKAHGLSLVELMIAIAIGLIVLAAVTVIFANTSATRNELERTSRQIENGRYAIELLTDDIRLAGFYGELNVPVDPTQTVCGGSALAALPDPCSAGTVDHLPLHMQAYDNGVGAPACVGTSLQPGSDVVVVRRVSTCGVGDPGCAGAVAGQQYLQVSTCNPTPPAGPEVACVLDVIPPGTSLHRKNCTTAAALRQYFVHIYFVSSDNGAGQNIPTLKMLTGPGSADALPLVEGIEYLNVNYGVDNTGDGLPDTYSANPVTVTDWRNVVTAQLFVLARNVDVSPGYSDTKTYSLGIDASGAPVTLGPFNDGYRRHVYTRLVRITNPAGRRDTP